MTGISRYTYIDVRRGFSVAGVPPVPKGVIPTNLGTIVVDGMSVAGVPIEGSGLPAPGVVPTGFDWLSLATPPQIASGGTPTPPPPPPPPTNTRPQQSAIIARWSSDAIPAQPDNTALASWTDSVGSIAAAQATPAAQPRYRTGGANGKPFVRFTQFQKLDAGSANAVMAAAVDQQDFTVIVVVRNITTADIGFIFTANNTGGVSVHASGSTAGCFAFGNARIPYTSTALTTVAMVQGKPDPSQARCYINGTSFSPVGKANVNTTNPDNRIIFGGNTTNGDYGFNGDLYEAIVWNRALTHPEMMQAEKWIRDKYALPYPWAGQPYRVFDGDSLTGGTGATSPLADYPGKVSTTNNWPIGTWTNLGYSGISMDTMRTRATTEVDPIITMIAGSTPVHLAAWEWYNQRGKADGNAAYLSTRGYFQDRRTAGFTKLMVLTSTDASDNAESAAERTKRADYNALLAANWTAFADGYVGIHTNTNIGVEGACPASAPFGTYFEDGIHLTNAGYAVLAGLAAPAMAAL